MQHNFRTFISQQFDLVPNLAESPVVDAKRNRIKLTVVYFSLYKLD